MFSDRCKTRAGFKNLNSVESHHSIYRKQGAPYKKYNILSKDNNDNQDLLQTLECTQIQ